MRKASSGFSADTVMVDVAVTRAGIPNDERYVLRTESPEPPIYPVQVPGWAVEIELQYRIMDTLGRHADVPVAPMIGYEPDPRVLGTPFFVMGFVDGRVPVEDPPYTTAGFFLDVPPAERTLMIERGLATLARVHALDWRDRGARLAGAAGDDAGARGAARALGGVLPGRAARPGAPARGAGVRVAPRRAAAVQPGRALLGRSAPGQHHLARRDSGVRDRLRGGIDRAAGARPRLVAHVRPHHARGCGGGASRGGPAARRAAAHVRGDVGARRCPTSVGSRSARRPATARSSCGS